MHIVNFQDSDEADRVFDAAPERVLDVLLRRSTVRLADFLKLPLEQRVPDLEVQRIDDSGHWIQQAYTRAVNGFLIDWLGRRFGVTRPG